MLDVTKGLWTIAGVFISFFIIVPIIEGVRDGIEEWRRQNGR